MKIAMVNQSNVKNVTSKVYNIEGTRMNDFNKQMQWNF